MAESGQPYSMGDWTVKDGHDEAFIAEWRSFAEWSMATAAGARSAKLLRDSGNRRHFISLGEWESPDAMSAWRGSEEFSERLGRCREHCEDFEAHDYSAAASTGP